MPDEQDAAPEANQSTSTEMVELIRSARTIVETGWPMAVGGNPELLIYDAIQRANLITGVVGLLLERKREGPAWSPEHAMATARLEHASDRMESQTEVIGEMIKLQREIYTELNLQTVALGEVSSMARKLFDLMKSEAEKASA